MERPLLSDTLPPVRTFFHLRAGPHPRRELTPTSRLRSTCLRLDVAAGALVVLRAHLVLPTALCTSAPGTAPTHQRTPPFVFLLTPNMSRGILMLASNRKTRMADSEVQYGTLDLMVLKTLDVMGPLHGYGIARRIEQAAHGSLALNQGTIYPALVRLENKGWITSDWGTSENNRRARFYAITRAGRKQLASEVESWARTVEIVNRLLEDQS